MRNAIFLHALLLLAAFGFAQSPSANITAAAKWEIPANFVSDAHTTCDKVTPSTKFNGCVIDQMSKAGAPAEAVAFTRELQKQTGGEVGIMSGFHPVGPVDIAWITYPLRQTHGLLLLNGKPRIINVEDLKLLDQKSLQASFQFQDLQNQFPQVALFPGDRDGKTWPNSQTGNSGGLQFIIGYPLRNGCETCAHAGFALFTWNFNPGGRFMGTSFMGMTPPPITTPSSSSPSQ